MPLAAIVAALSSAFIHASWNAVLKAGKDRLNDSAVTAVFWLLVGAAVVSSRPPVNPEIWPYLVASSVAHTLYWGALAKGFGAGDMSHVYTLSRGLAPVLITIGAAFAASEIPSAHEAFGIALVCAGVLAVGFSPRAPLRATGWAALTAFCISCYSVVDGIGVRRSGDAFAFAGWSFIVCAIPILLFALWRRGPKPLAAAMRAEWRRGAIVGVISAIGYTLVLWAQTIAPIAQVSALRETSIVFGAFIAFALLREKLGARRWIGAIVVAAGAVVIAT